LLYKGFVYLQYSPFKTGLVPGHEYFIEAKNLRDLPWEELASQEIRLLVCPLILREIDEHKTNSKNRVSERAKK